jgi:putative ABC transport system permease protein
MNNNNSISPPRIAQFILRLFTRYDHTSYFLGDLEENYNRISKNSGSVQAYLWYWLQCFITVPGCIKNHSYWSIVMFKNYMKTAVRNILKYKAFSFINISGLAVGYAIFILAYLFCDLNITADEQHKNSDRTYGIIQVKQTGDQNENHSAILPAPLMKALVADYPVIEDATQFFSVGRKIIKRDNIKFYESRIMFAENNFLTFLTFDIISGDPETALDKPNSIVMTETSAIKYFGNSDPVGQTVMYENDIPLTVTAVIKDITGFSGLYFKFLISMETAHNIYTDMDSWSSSFQQILIRLPVDYNPVLLDKELPDFVARYFDDSPDSPDRMYLYPMLDFQFKSLDISSYWRTGPLAPLYGFIAMGFMMLIVVSINFMNLSTAKYTTRAKEIGVRKVAGAHRFQMINQFIGESVLISLLAFPAGILIFEFIKPFFIAFYEYQFLFSLWDHPLLIMKLLVMALFVGIIAGSYPAFYLTSLKPVNIIKNKLRTGKKGLLFRKTLVVSQFFLSVMLIVFTVVVSNQFDYLMNADFGYSRENIIVVPISGEAKKNITLLKEELLKHPDVTHVSGSDNIPGIWSNEESVNIPGKPEEDSRRMDVYGVGYDFIETMQINLTAGRGFSEDYGDRADYIINERAAQKLQLSEPVGAEIKINGETGIVAGKTEDFNFRMVHRKTAPALLRLRPVSSNYMYIKTSSPDNLAAVTDYISEKWQALNPELPFSYRTFDEYFFDFYEQTKKGAEITGAIGLVIILVSCLGMFGLASFTIQRKMKEIGVRKVFGAHASDIGKILGREFIILVVAANLIASLPTWYLAKIFLDNMYVSYPAEIGIGIFIFAALVTIVSAAGAVFSQTFKAAKSNPVNSLRYE